MSLSGVSFYHNAICLMVGTAVTSVIRFVFWTVAAGLCSAEDVSLSQL